LRRTARVTHVSRMRRARFGSVPSMFHPCSAARAFSIPGISGDASGGRRDRKKREGSSGSFRSVRREYKDFGESMNAATSGWWVRIYVIEHMIEQMQSNKSQFHNRMKILTRLLSVHCGFLRIGKGIDIVLYCLRAMTGRCGDRAPGAAGESGNGIGRAS
jgi:hypothetical protein